MDTQVNKNTAVFLDRDGTLAKDVPYCSRPQDFELFAAVPAAINALNRNGFKVILVTNQSGIARGYFTQEMLGLIHEKLKTELARQHARIDGIYYCPHHPDDGCDCRKPGTALFERAARDFNIELSASYVVGDKELDILPGKKLNCKTVLVSNGNAPLTPLQADYQAADLFSAAEWIIRDCEGAHE